MKNCNYDAIIIGSGIGGLTTAALLSLYNNKKVLVLEQSSNPGGQTQSFKRQGGFSWDTGLQYVGEMADQQLGKTVFDYISESSIKWKKISIPQEKYCFPNFTFDVPDKPHIYLNRLIKMFPFEKKALQRYFSDLKSIRNWTLRFYLNGSFPYPLVILNKIWNILPNRLAKMTTSEYMDKFFCDDKLKAILTAQWGTYGLPPDKSMFAHHAFITYHFLYGAWYPIGGSGEIFKSIFPVIKRNGGEIKLNTCATKIIVNNQNKAIGVKTVSHRGGEFKEMLFESPLIISGIGIRETVDNLLSENSRFSKLYNWNNLTKGCSCVVLYAGLSRNPVEIGFQESNYWIFNKLDFNKLFREKENLMSGDPNHCWLSFPSIKDSKAKAHTAMLVYFIKEDPFLPWKDTKWKKRGEKYQQVKNKIANSLLQFVNKRFSGFSDIVSSWEVSTPLTINHFIRKKYGAMYGIAAVPGRFSSEMVGPKTAIKNLYFTGGDAFCAGIVGAMWGGVSCAASINGQFGMLKLLHAMKFNLPNLICDIYF